MVRPASKTPTLISLVLHLGIIAALWLYATPLRTMIPSRSDGIEVSLVSMPNQTIQPYAPPAPLKISERSADINLKQKKIAKPQKLEVQPKVEPKITKTLAPKDNRKTQAPPTSKAKQQNKRVQVNDLLGDILSPSTTSVHKGKAVGGNPKGSSDSNNLIGNYADQVINAVRPFVVIPENINPDASAIVKVELNPDLSVQQVTLLKSSGNDDYDESVQTAIMRVKVFPDLPDDANYVDFRILKLTFHP